MVDYLIVGAGLYGATCARLLTDKGFTCLVIDKRPYIAGNIYTYKKDGVDIHKYGPHIFHTDSDVVWEFVNKFCTMRQFQLNTIANYNGKLYHLPFNLTTMYELFGTYNLNGDINNVNDIIDNEIAEYLKNNKSTTDNLESHAISMVGTTIFNTLIKGYTEKQWGKPCTKLPSSIIKRLPVRYSFNNNYFNDKYQGIPEEGYTTMVENMLTGIPVLLNTDYLNSKIYWNSIAKHVIYCGAPDELLNYKFGPLEWRSLKFDTKEFDVCTYQGIPIMNFTSKDIPYTRIIEHKFFTPYRPTTTTSTTITFEYPQKWKQGDEKYYAVNNDKTKELYYKYIDEIKNRYNNVVLGGRLGYYKYMDMDDTILAAMKYVDFYCKKI